MTDMYFQWHWGQWPKTDSGRLTVKDSSPFLAPVSKPLRSVYFTRTASKRGSKSKFSFIVEKSAFFWKSAAFGIKSVELIGDLQYLKSFIAAFHIGNNGHPSPYPTEVWWSFAPAEAERCPKMPPVFSRAIHGPQKNLRTCWRQKNADDFKLSNPDLPGLLHGKRHGLRWQVLFLFGRGGSWWSWGPTIGTLHWKRRRNT